MKTVREFLNYKTDNDLSEGKDGNGLIDLISSLDVMGYPDKVTDKIVASIQKVKNINKKELHRIFKKAGVEDKHVSKLSKIILESDGEEIPADRDNI